MTEYNLIGDEILIGVFNEFPKEKNLDFKDESNIMLAFYKMSKNQKFNPLFKNYYFDEDGIVPYSKEIADGINILHQTSLMGKVNPSFSFHRLSKGIEIRYKKFLSNKLDERQKELLHELSQNIKKELLEA